MKTTPFVVTIALLAHGALAADLDETAKAREHFAETYRNVIDQAVVYDQLRRDELADLEVHLDEVEKSLTERLDTDVGAI